MPKSSYLFPFAILLLISGASFAQGWIEYSGYEDGFFLNFPGEPTIEEITWESEYGAMLPARIFSSESPRGRYSMTVVDYRDAERIHAERLGDIDCPEGAETCLGSLTTGVGYWRVDTQGSMVYGAWQYFQRDAEVTHFMWNFTNLVEGLQIQLTNPDQSRTFASLYLHDDRLYIIEATAPDGVRGPGFFQQSLGFLDEDGANLRYEYYYHNSMREWTDLPPRRR